MRYPLLGRERAERGPGGDPGPALLRGGCVTEGRRVRFNPLGNTGLLVSEVALGTAELGIDYGFRGGEQYRKPDPGDALRVVHRALDLGINLFDTARTYGSSEEVIGRALAGVAERPYIASKVAIPPPAGGGLGALSVAIHASIDASLRALRAETVDLLQVHNATRDILRDEAVRSVLEDAQRQGKVRFVGASAYGDEDSLEAVGSGFYRTLQVPLSLLDQKASRAVLPAAAENGVGVLTRSAFLRGVLTQRLASIPERLEPLRRAALNALGVLECDVTALPEAALRFCLSFRGVSSVIVGVKTVAELESNVESARKGPLAPAVMTGLRSCAVEDETLINPFLHWQDLI
jgi:aryl-alcohol dehydrogenase-like predicted oxidoreductase